MQPNLYTSEKPISEDYISIFLPYYNSVQFKRGFVMSDDTIELINDIVGSRRAFGNEWFTEIGNDTFDWSVRGITHYNDKECIQIMVKDPSKAMMLKLSLNV